MSIALPSGSGGEAFALRLAQDDRGFGWVIFAGSILLLVGTLNVIEGIAAVSGSRFFVHRANYIVGDLTSWGWVLIALGCAEIASGFGVLVKNQLARWAGVGFAMLNATAQLLFMPAYPYWALTLFTLDIFVLYGLIVHGGRVFRPV